MSFSDRIIQLKKERKLLQKDIASSFGLSLSAYQYYEKWQNDELDIDKLKEDLWVYGGVRLEEVEGK